MSRPTDNKLPVLRFLVLFSALLTVALSLAALSSPAEPTAEPALPAPPGK